MKRNLRNFLMAAFAAMLGVNAWADTEDVTSTYLTNADFSTDDAISVNLCAYKADISKSANLYNGSSALYWTQSVTGWTYTNNADTNAGAIFAYGSDQKMCGNQKTAPATNPSGEASGKALGIFAVWTGTVQYTQEVTLPKGVYKMSYTYYNQSGTGTITNLFGFVPTEGTATYSSATTFTVGAWTTADVTFELLEETSGKISVGYKAPNSGSSACPMLFVDNVKLEKTSIDVSALTAEIAKVQNEVNNSTADDKTTITEAIEAAQAIADAPESIAQVAEAVTTLETARQTYVLTAVPNDGYSFDYTFKVGDIYNTSAWTYTTGAQNHQWKASTTKNTDDYVADGFYENWKSSNFSGDIYTTLTGLREGHYNVSALAFNNITTGTATFFAGDKTTALSTETTLFQQPTIDDVVVSDGNLKLGLTVDATNWVGISTVNLYYISEITVDEKILNEIVSMQALGEELAAKIPTANISSDDSEPFKYKQSLVTKANALVTAYSGYTAEQVAAGLKAKGTDSETGLAYYSLEFLAAYKAKMLAGVEEMLTPIMPTEAMKAKIQLVYSGWTYDGKYMSGYADSAAPAGYYLGYDAYDADGEYQLFTLTPTSDGYVTFSFNDGTSDYYMCTNLTGYETGNARSIRVTTDADKALKVKVTPSTTVEDILNFYNPEAEMYIGSQDRGVYTVNSHNDFKLVTTWTKTGRVVCIDSWGKLCQASMYWAPVTVTGSYNNTTLTLADKYGYTTTITAGDEDAITEMDGTTDITSSTAQYVGSDGYFCLGSDIYSIYAYPGYYSYANADENTGYVTLSGWFYGDNTDWGYIDIEWGDDALAAYPVPETRATAAGGYGTVCLPYPAYVEGATVYAVTGLEDDNTTLVLEAVTSPAAGTPYIYQATKANQTFRLDGITTDAVSAPVATDYLTGVFEATNITSGYVLQCQNDKYGFYKVSGTKTVPAYRAYYSAESEAKALNFSTDATAIKAIESLTSGNAKIYDINGRQIYKLQKGINIVNGVKVLVK